MPGDAVAHGDHLARGLVPEDGRHRLGQGAVAGRQVRGAQVAGRVRCVEDPAGVLEIGRGVAGRMAGVPAEAVEEYVAHAARKRVGFVVEPARIVSWDHRKLIQPPAD